MTASLMYREIGLKQSGPSDAHKLELSKMYFAQMHVKVGKPSIGTRGLTHHKESVNLFRFRSVSDYLQGDSPGIPKDVVHHDGIIVVLTDAGLCVSYSCSTCSFDPI